MQTVSALCFKSSFYHAISPFLNFCLKFRVLAYSFCTYLSPYSVFSHKLNLPHIFPILLAVSKEVPKLAGKNMVMDLQQEDFIKLKGTRKLFH